MGHARAGAAVYRDDRIQLKSQARPLDFDALCDFLLVFFAGVGGVLSVVESIETIADAAVSVALPIAAFPRRDSRARVLRFAQGDLPGAAGGVGGSRVLF